MRPLSPTTEHILRRAVTDQAVIGRYHKHIKTVAGMACPRIWTGAISGNGHGRFWLGDTADGRAVTIIAHRFGWALHHGVDSLLGVEVVSHSCDNPLCQTPEHWQPRTNADNRREWAQRRRTPGSPLRDRRGARGRATEIRDTARISNDVLVIAQTGLGDDIYQDHLFSDTHHEES